jgi:cysteine sulfinate desulfinase/cysteine desulfurase-like protein
VETQAKSSIRISYGKFNTIDEVEKIVAATGDAYAKINEIAVCMDKNLDESHV